MSEAQRFQRVMGLFEQACGLTDTERAAFLRDACGEDDDLLRDVQAMLDQDVAGAGTFGNPGAGVRLLAEAVADEIGSAEAVDANSASGGGTAAVINPTGAPRLVPIPLLAGQYRIIRVIGEGGMGIVYLAQQARPRRLVALKALRPGTASRHLLRRFEHEAQILGRLQHPGIAQIYEAGAADANAPDQAYFAMEYVDGPPLTKFADDYRLDLHRRLRLFNSVCEAVQHAHHRGVIHRDLKPSNILVVHAAKETEKRELSLQPKILDFGVARDVDADTIHTLQGQLVGTLPYMSPEQVSGEPQQHDVRTDVYALGVILYELLTGRQPLDVRNKSIPEAVRIIGQQQPVAPASFNPVLRGDLEVIILKAIEKDAAQRYQSAADLAGDIRRHLNDEPILARPASPVEQALRFARRNRALVGGVVAVLIALMAGTIVSAVFAIRATGASKDAQAAEQLAHSRYLQAQKNAEEGRRQAYLANIRAAQSALELNDVAAARLSLESIEPDLRSNFEWRHFESRLEESTRVIDGFWTWLAISPDGSLLAAADLDGQIHLFDSTDFTHVRAVDSGQESISRLKFSLDGRHLASASEDGTIKIWEVATGQALRILAGHQNAVSDIAFSPDHRLLASASHDKTIALWEASTGQVLRRLTGHAHVVTGIDLSHDGTCLVSTDQQGHIFVWNVASGELTGETMMDAGPTWAVAFAPDGARFATAHEDSLIRVWDARTLQIVDTLHGHTDGVRALAYSPDGTRIASGSEDTTVRTWSTQSGRQLTMLNGHIGPVSAVVWAHSGDQILSTSAALDGSIRVWSASAADDVEVLRGHTWHVRTAAFEPGGSRFVTSSTDGTIRFWDADTALERTPPISFDGPLWSVAVSPRGDFFAVGLNDGSIRLLDRRTHDEVGRLSAHSSAVHGLTFNQQGTHLASRAVDEVAIWDCASRQSVIRIGIPTNRIASMAFSPDGQLMAIAENEGRVRIFDARSGQQQAEFGGKKRVIFGVEFAPSGGGLAVATSDGHVELWEVHTRRPMPITLRHTDAVLSLAFSPDGRRIATGTDDGRVRLWNAENGDEVAQLRGHSSSVFCLAFSADGNILVSGSSDQTIRIWRTRPTSGVLEARQRAQRG